MAELGFLAKALWFLVVIWPWFVPWVLLQAGLILIKGWCVTKGLEMEGVDRNLLKSREREDPSCAGHHLIPLRVLPQG